MSKIFNALTKTKGELASLVLPLINSAGAGESESDLQSEPWHQTVPDLETLPVERVFGTPEVVLAPDLSRVVFYTEPGSVAADRFRLLRTRLRDLSSAGSLRSILITSPLPSEGKSTTALNLATALTEDGTKKVLLIDADLHRGSLSSLLGLSEHPGLSECLRDGLNPASAARLIEPVAFYLLSAGNVRLTSQTELLQPRELGGVFKFVARHYDWVIVDCPPVLPLSDAVSICAHVDKTLMVIRAGSTPAKAVEEAISLIGKQNVLGLVLNGIEDLDRRYAGYYKYYGSRSTD